MIKLLNEDMARGEEYFIALLFSDEWDIFYTFFYELKSINSSFYSLSFIRG